jgi:hypothetical protein
MRPRWYRTPRRTIAMTCSDVKRGVPRSPNHHLNQFGVMWRFDLGRRKIQSNRLRYIAACFRFRLPRRPTARQFGTYCRPTFGNAIKFRNYAELHETVYGA